MRLWSLHPKYLDRQGLTACWREGLLAQTVLAGRTRGYRAHPQLERFRDTAAPTTTIATYLHAVAEEADARGYRYDRSRVDAAAQPDVRLTVSVGQLDFEWSWLTSKLQDRSPDWHARWEDVDRPMPHPMFRVIDGPVAAWERGHR